MKLAAPLTGLVIVAGCGQVESRMDNAGNNSEKWNVNIEELHAYVHSVPTFEAVERSLQSQGKALNWAAITVDRWEDDGLPLALHMPIISGGIEKLSPQDELRFEWTKSGEAIVQIPSFSTSNNIAQSPPEHSYYYTCDLGAFQVESSCGIASNTFQRCTNGAYLWQRQIYVLDYYVNGRQLIGPEGALLYNCGTLSSDSFCSSVCYNNPV